MRTHVVRAFSCLGRQARKRAEALNRKNPQKFEITTKGVKQFIGHANSREEANQIEKWVDDGTGQEPG